MSVYSNAEEITEKVGKKIVSGIEDNILHSNKAINPITSLFGVAEFGSRVFSNPENLNNIGDVVANAAKKTWTEDGALKMGKIAGSYIGAAAGYRMLSGGGLYRDKNGDANIIGIPFV